MNVRQRLREVKAEGSPGEPGGHLRHVSLLFMGKRRSKKPGAISAIGIGLSLGLLVVLGGLFVFRPDWAAAATLLPGLFWLLVGVVATLLAMPRRRAFLILLGLWVLFGFVYVEGIRSSLRPGFRIADETRAPGANLRIVSLNCGGGVFEAAEEVAAYRPDIVLFQETVGRDDLERLAGRMFGDAGAVLPGLDGSIVARGTLRAVPLPQGTANFVMADADVRGTPLQLVSLRLRPPVERVDLWNRECWAIQTRDRRERRAELADILAFVEVHRKGAPLIVGGDFNAVAGDASLRPIEFLRDSFDQAGRGWCDTAVNDYPFARIDRIFTCDRVQVLASSVRKTRHSDHRMLIVDVQISE
jgi:vancomycin resistance protein VanJ